MTNARHMICIASHATFIVCALFYSTILRAQFYTAVPLGALGGAATHATGINNSGQIVGYSETTGGAYHAFLFSSGVMTDLGTLGGDNSYAYAINSSGAVTGYAFISGDVTYHAFTASGGTMTDLSPGSATSTGGRGINDLGQVVGYRFRVAGYNADFSDAVLFSDGTITNYGTLGGSARNSGANGINNSGQIVATFDNPTYTADWVFTISGGTMTNLGLFALTNSGGNAINSSGQITGWGGPTGGYLYSDGVATSIPELTGGPYVQGQALNSFGTVVGGTFGTDLSRAFIYTDGVTTDLNGLVNIEGVTLRVATGINDYGVIIADGSDGNAYLLTPVPEPAAYAVVLGALALSAAVMQRSRRRSSIFAN